MAKKPWEKAQATQLCLLFLWVWSLLLWHHVPHTEHITWPPVLSLLQQVAAWKAVSFSVWKRLWKQWMEHVHMFLATKEFRMFHKSEVKKIVKVIHINIWFPFLSSDSCSGPSCPGLIFWMGQYFMLPCLFCSSIREWLNKETLVLGHLISSQSDDAPMKMWGEKEKQSIYYSGSIPH